MTTEGNPGTVRIAPNVLATIAQRTTLSVEGVAGMAQDPTTRFRRMLTSGSTPQGVQIEVSDNSVGIDLHIIAYDDVSLLDLGREIRGRVARAIRDTVGMAVHQVNIHIQDVACPEDR